MTAGEAGELSGVAAAADAAVAIENSVIEIRALRFIFVRVSEFFKELFRMRVENRIMWLVGCVEYKIEHARQWVKFGFSGVILCKSTVFSAVLQIYSVSSKTLCVD